MNELTIIQRFAIWALPLLFAITVHEVAHGWVANKLGDNTARMFGRLTLNPLKHIDPVGTVLVPGILLMLGGFIFGWAKPVPVNDRNLHNPRRDMALVALAGPMANFLMALGWALFAKIGLLLESEFATIPMVYMGSAGIFINLVLMLLNLLPIPPLDGGRIAAGLLPPRLAWKYSKIEPFGFPILLILLFTGWLGKLLGFPLYLMQGLIHGLFGV